MTEASEPDIRVDTGRVSGSDSLLEASQSSLTSESKTSSATDAGVGISSSPGIKGRSVATVEAGASSSG